MLTLKKDPGFRNQVSEETSAHLLLGAQDQQLGATSSGNCQETETSMVRACHAPRQPLQTILQGTLDNGRRRVISRGNTGWTVKGWTSLPIAELFTLASGRKDWKSVSTEMSLIFLPTIYLVEGLNRIELYQM